MSDSYKILFIKACHGPQGIEVPLGILYLSAYLKHHLSNKIKIDLIDLRLEKNWTRALGEKLKTCQPDLIGISLLSGDRPFLDSWMTFLKNTSPGARIVIGGPLASYDYAEILRHHRTVDFAVIGEGEVAFLNLVRVLMKNEKAVNLNSVACLEDGQIVLAGKEKPIENLDGLPFPDYNLIDLDRYTNHGHTMNGVLSEKRHVHIISSRGCPYGCLYCHDIFGKKTRTRSPENFLEEIRWLYYQQGVREFHIVDDIFNFDKQRLHDILHRIINSDMRIKIAFPNGIRADLLDETDILLLKQAGCYMITFAVETASPRMQKVIRKNLNVTKVVENIKFASRAGLITRSFFMLGFPGETVEEIKATIDLAVKSPLDLVFFFTVVPFKNTGLAHLVDREYPRLNYQDGHYWGQIPFYQQATGYPLKQVQIMAYIKFYLPFRIFRTFLKLPHKGRIFACWVNMAVYITFTPWYEYLQSLGRRKPAALPQGCSGLNADRAKL